MKNDPFKLLKDDHKKVAKLFKELEGTGERAIKTKEALFEQLKSELELHTQIEEEYMYPLLEAADETKDLTLEAYEEHDIVKTLMTEMEDEEVGSDVWEAKLKVMKENVEHHVSEEEEELFPEAEEVLSEEQVEQLAQSIIEAKQNQAPAQKTQAK